MTRLIPRRRPLPVTAILLGSAAALVGVIAATSGVYAYFTSSATATATLTEGGSVSVAWAAAPDGSPLSFSVGPLQPSDSSDSSKGRAQRVGDLVNTGSNAIARLQLAVVGVGTGSTSDGIQIAIDRCSVSWVSSAGSLSCPGDSTVVSPERPVQAVINLNGSSALTPGHTDHLRFTFSLPASAPTAAQATSSTITLTATGSSSQ